MGRKKNREKTRPGRRLGIQQAELQNARGVLLGLLENTWGHVGWNLMNLRSANDVHNCFRIWKTASDPYRVQVLLHPVTAVFVGTPDPRNLRKMRKRLEELADSIRETSDRQHLLREDLGIINRALANATEDQRVAIAEERSRQAQALADSDRAAEVLNRQWRELRAALLHDEAVFAHAEIVHFCTSHRYRLTPLRVANALAGLPDIGCRQSAKRLLEGKHKEFRASLYEVFRIIRGIVRSCPVKGDLPERVKQWLLGKRGSQSHASLELREKWYYLSRAIDKALKANHPPPALPFMIVAEYSRRRTSPTSVDLVLERRERLVV